MEPGQPTEVCIVLVGTAGPANLGAIARVMKNFGLQQLRLVAPLCSPADPEAVRMAVHAADLLRDARIYPDLAAALADCHRTIGTSARLRTTPFSILDPQSAAYWLLAAPSPVAYVFGPEDRGLSNAELALCQRQLRIPTAKIYPSLNLAQAVGICVHNLFTCGLMQAEVGGPAPPAPAVAADLEGFYEHLEQTLLTIGYLQPHTAARKLEKFRHLFNRAGLTAEEVALLRGILRQVGWAHRQEVQG